MMDISETPEHLTVSELIKGINEHAYEKLPTVKKKKNDYVTIYKEHVTPLKNKQVKMIELGIPRTEKKIKSDVVETSFNSTFGTTKNKKEFVKTKEKSNFDELNQNKTSFQKFLFHSKEKKSDKQHKSSTKVSNLRSLISYGLIIGCLVCLLYFFHEFIPQFFKKQNEVVNFEEFLIGLLKTQEEKYLCQLENEKSLSLEYLKLKFLEKFPDVHLLFFETALNKFQNIKEYKVLFDKENESYQTNYNTVPLSCHLTIMTSWLLTFLLKVLFGFFLLAIAVSIVKKKIRKWEEKKEIFKISIDSVYTKILSKLKKKNKYEVAQLRTEVIEGPFFLPMIEDKSHRLKIWNAVKMKVRTECSSIIEHNKDEYGIDRIVWEWNNESNENCSENYQEKRLPKLNLRKIFNSLDPYPSLS